MEGTQGQHCTRCTDGLCSNDANCGTEFDHDAATEVNARWQAEMAEYFVDLAGASPDTGFIQLEEIFNLEDQLAVLAPDDPGSDLT